MRITTAQLYDNLLTGVKRQLEIQDRGNAQIASGTRFQKPAEAGLDYKLSLDIRHAQTGIQGSLDAIDVVDARLSISQTLLKDMGSILTRAQALAVQQSSAGSSGPAERQTVANEISHLLESLLGNANQKWQGQSVFAGTAVDQPAFIKDGTGKIIYNGSNQDITVAIDTNQQVASNLRGDAPAFVAAFSAMEGFLTALQNNDVPAIRSSLGMLISAGDGMIDLTTDAGARLNSIRILQDSFEDLKLHLDTQLNTHESVDVPKVVSGLQQSNTALQAAYSLIAQIKTLSLVSFLR